MRPRDPRREEPAGHRACGSWPAPPGSRLCRSRCRSRTGYGGAEEGADRAGGACRFPGGARRLRNRLSRPEPWRVQEDIRFARVGHLRLARFGAGEPYSSLRGECRCGEEAWRLDKGVIPLAEESVPARGRHRDRKSVVWGKSVSVRVEIGGRRLIKKT